MRTPEFWQRILAAELAPAKNRVLLEELGSFASDPLHLLSKSAILGDKERKRAEAASMTALQSELAAGAGILEYDDYPELLLESGNVPPALFIKGDAECLRAPTVAIVGTRNASPYGRACALKFGEALAKAGVTIVSGGALGIDGAAHKGALDAGGKTAAVLATGIENVYPRVHSGLFRQISQSGCLVSQFAVGASMSDYKFLIRNVLVAGLSSGVIVIEAPARSGAISTAMAANELGREVFVVPANIDHRGFYGSFNLLRDGATFVNHPDQVLEALQFDLLTEPEEPALPEVSDIGGVILSVLSAEPMSTELIVAKTGIEAADILSELTVMELEGRVLRDPLGYAIRP